MTNVEFGVTGAKRTSIHKSDPINLLWEIRDRYPTAGTRDLLLAFRDAVKNDDDMMDSVIAYCFANLQHRIDHPRRSAKHPKRTTSDIENEMRGAIDKSIRDKAAELLMDMAMPNGKRLGDCTIAYCAKLGGWMNRLAKGQNPRKTISMVYDEEDLVRLRKG